MSASRHQPARIWGKCGPDPPSVCLFVLESSYAQLAVVAQLDDPSGPCPNAVTRAAHVPNLLAALDNSTLPV